MFHSLSTTLAQGVTVALSLGGTTSVLHWAVRLYLRHRLNEPGFADRKFEGRPAVGLQDHVLNLCQFHGGVLEKRPPMSGPIWLSGTQLVILPPVVRRNALMQVRAVQGNAQTINDSRFATKSFHSIAALAFSPVFVFEAGAVRARARGPALHRWCPSLRWGGGIDGAGGPVRLYHRIPIVLPLCSRFSPSRWRRGRKPA